MRRIVVVSDCQAPYSNKRQVNSLAGFIRTTKPDDVYCVGDVADLPMVSRWTKNRRGEFSGNIQEHADEVTRILEKLQVRHLRVGNHDRRVENYVEQYAPALSPIKSLKMESMFRLGDIGVTLHRELWEFSPGFILAHGDEGSLSSTGGQTALNLARQVRKSVVCSHTHRQGIIFEGSSMNNIVGPTLIGMEVGHMMNVSDATYLRSGKSNWTAGFGVLDISNGKVAPHVVQMSPTGGFVWEGKSWEDGRVAREKLNNGKRPKAQAAA